jgi:hypothetical protein
MDVDPIASRLTLAVLSLLKLLLFMLDLPQCVKTRNAVSIAAGSSLLDVDS